ncbi:3-oxoacyl-[acyl-carrier protein] reductase [Cladophialophora psammophila CBS 110553]|uniref:3-oxoacyl-[acyl-carrier protein] reductase n=1 Tax=Cladophialophora psammophila CBS 110553 TaxID=1182543 RepID=W9XBF1_9EURO|nr:3-oxoacyl-[acyl-carrier protein] reductase [Cladophialophora psammophila CBS 110553]EXJ67764.1 3-oxoacyl-[acyl-carrier protein] reductase [Cladophialophora psammophila CBS 110553]
MSSAPLSGKVAVITGGTKGIGASTATLLVKLGAKVVVNYGRDSAAAEKIVSQLGSDKAYAVQADAGTIAGVEQLVKATVEKFGQIDILIPNAGILPMKTVESCTEEDFDRTFSLNVKGPFFLVQKALPYMARGSSIVLISTTLCHASTVNGPYTLYCATKGSIEQLTRLLSKDLLASKGIRVNAVAPGPTATDLFLEGKSPQVLQMLASFHPANRIGKPEEIAEAIAFLCGQGAEWVSGQTIRVNGGMA